LTYHTPASSVDYQKNSFSTARSEIETIFLTTLFTHRSLNTSRITSYHEPYLRYSTNSSDPSMRNQRHASLF